MDVYGINRKYYHATEVGGKHKERMNQMTTPTIIEETYKIILRTISKHALGPEVSIATNMADGSGTQKFQLTLKRGGVECYTDFSLSWDVLYLKDWKDAVRHHTESALDRLAQYAESLGGN